MGDIRSHIGEEVVLKGFVRTLRDQKKMQFLIVYDHSGAVQAIHTKADDPAIAEAISSLTDESAVVVAGLVVEAPNVKLGGVEIQIRSVEVANLADSPLPIKEDSSLELRMDKRQLSLRNGRDQLIMRVQTTLEHAMRDYWLQHGFTEIHSPKLISTASESGAELFSLPYFGGTAYLAQSPQFYKQLGIAGGLDRVFEIGPVFRANPSFTSRHDTEFTSVDMEMAWISSHEDVMEFEEAWLRYSIAKTAEEHGAEIAAVFGVSVEPPSLPFPRLTLAEARARLAERGHVIGHKADLDPEGERLLSALVEEETGSQFVFVTDYPAEVRAFYHMRYPDRPDITKSYDLLWRGLEITTGAQREHRPDVLRAQAQAKGFNLEPLEDYLGFFSYGCPPHGGCGVGLTRMLVVMLGLHNVREVTFLYRGPNRLRP
jgi:aspartyl-tRNA synthetase